LTPEKGRFRPLGRVKTASALSPEGLTPEDVKMGKTKCARF
jgi:hypothetical protein